MATTSWVLMAPIAAAIILVQVVWMWKVFRYFRATGCSQLFRRAAALMEAKPLEPEVQQVVSQLLATRRLKYCTLVTSLAWTVSLFASWSILFHVLRRREIKNELLAVGRVGFLLLFTLAMVFPRIVRTGPSMAMLHVCAMVLLAYLELVDMEAEVSPTRGLIVLMLSLLFSGLCLRFRLLLVSNGMLALVSLVKAFITREEQQEGWTFQSLLVAQLILFGSKSIFFFAADSIVEYSARMEVSARCGRCQQSAVTSLLDMMCDAVVEVDRDMLLKEHFPKLAGMLMHGKGRSLGGESLLQFIPDEADQKRIKAALNRTSPTPGMLTLCLKDCIGNKIKVVLFYVPYLSIGGRKHNLIGLREESDLAGDVVNAASAGNSTPSGPALPAAVLKPDLAKRLRPESSHSSSTLRSHSRETIQPSGDLTVEVFLEDGLPIRWISPKLKNVFGLDGDRLERLALSTPDGGSALLAGLESVVSELRASDATGRFIRSLGHFNILRIQDGREEVLNRPIWANIELPMPELEGSRPCVAIAFSKNGLRSRGAAGGTQGVRGEAGVLANPALGGGLDVGGVLSIERISSAKKSSDSGSIASLRSSPDRGRHEADSQPASSQALNGASSPKRLHIAL